MKSFTFEKSEVSSANILQIEDMLGKSLIYMRKRSGPSTDPCGIPTSIFFQEELRSFRTTLWLRFLSKFPRT